MILIMNVLNFFLYNLEIFKRMQLYTPFLMSLMLMFIAKLMVNALIYFGNSELSYKWKYIGEIIFYGFSLPYYTLVSIKVCGIVSFKLNSITPGLIVLFLPLVFIVLSLLIYYLHTLVLTFRFLLKLQEKGIS